jgi:hypothetical protein
MIKHYAGALLVAAAAVLAAPAFASGYGPAPHYRPDVGAPDSQRGISSQTIAAQEAQRDEASGNAGADTLQASNARTSRHAQVQQ